MRRRLFFRALVGAPVVAVSQANSTPEPVLAKLNQIPDCACGFEFVIRRVHSEDYSKLLGEYMTCRNPGCRNFRKLFALPTVALTPFDPGRGAALERERLRQEKAAIAEKERAERAQNPMYYVQASDLNPGPWYPGKVSSYPSKVFYGVRDELQRSGNLTEQSLVEALEQYERLTTRAMVR